MAEQGNDRNVLLISLGCDKNRVDSERMLGLLIRDGYNLVQDEADADIIVVNTCCFIDSAKEESIGAILEMAEQRREGRCRKLIVAGCMAERYKEEIFSEIPEVDVIVGTGSYDQILEAVSKEKAGCRPSYMTPLSKGISEEPPRILTTGGFFAYLKIAEGCDRHCTYCVIPSLRGPYRSFPEDNLLKEAASLAESGVRELILVAQDTARYGEDLYGEKRLHVLLNKLSQIESLKWIRVLYVYPEEIYPELIEVIKENPKVCHYLDIPIQHSEDAVLRRMGRRTTRKNLIRIVNHLREEIPDIVLRTTLITGFPGETEEEHKQLLLFIQNMRFERLGVFTYSREEGTPAARMADQIPEEEKTRRMDELLSAQQQISLEKGKQRIGERMQVFIEGFIPEEGVWVGRTYADAPDVDGLFFAESMQELHSGDFIPAVVTDAGEYDLIGYTCQEEEGNEILE